MGFATIWIGTRPQWPTRVATIKASWGWHPSSALSFVAGQDLSKSVFGVHVYKTMYNACTRDTRIGYSGQQTTRTDMSLPMALARLR